MKQCEPSELNQQLIQLVRINSLRALNELHNAISFFRALRVQVMKFALRCRCFYGAMTDPPPQFFPANCDCIEACVFVLADPIT